MKSKLLTTLFIVLLALAFSACSEEEINPTTHNYEKRTQGSVDIDNF